MADAHPSVENADCLRAIEVGSRLFLGARRDDEPFRLVAVTNLVRGGPPPTGPSIWELLFKPVRLMPSGDRAEAGAGGEWRLRIDLDRPGEPLHLGRED